MKTLLKFVLTLCILALAAVYGGGSYAVNSLSHKYLPRVSSSLSTHGIDLGEVVFRKAHFSGPRTLSWYEVHTTALVEAPAPIRKKRVFDISVDRASVSPVDLTLHEAIIELHGATIAPHGAEGESSVVGEATRSGAILNEQFSIEHAQLIVPIAASDLRPAFTTAQNTVRQLLQNGSTTSDFDLLGSVRLKTAKGDRTVRVSTREGTEGRSIELNAEDLAQLSPLFEEPLTPAEIQIVAHHPLQAPLLMAVRHRAESTAKEAQAKDPSVPYDAYRYVLWSYLLSKEFGEQFAESVTNAHEDVTGQPAEERNMDLKNAAAGRAFAKRGAAESDILRLVRSDPQVVRDNKAR